MHLYPFLFSIVFEWKTDEFYPCILSAFYMPFDGDKLTDKMEDKNLYGRVDEGESNPHHLFLKNQYY
jgi:hypothetical protein